MNDNMFVFSLKTNAMHWIRSLKNLIISTFSPQFPQTMNEIIETVTRVHGRINSFQSVIELAAEALGNEPECHGIIALLSDPDSYLESSGLAGAIAANNNRVSRKDCNCY